MAIAWQCSVNCAMQSFCQATSCVCELSLLCGQVCSGVLYLSLNCLHVALMWLGSVFQVSFCVFQRHLKCTQRHLKCLSCSFFFWRPIDHSPFRRITNHTTEQAPNDNSRVNDCAHSSENVKTLAFLMRASRWAGGLFCATALSKRHVFSCTFQLLATHAGSHVPSLQEKTRRFLTFPRNGLLRGLQELSFP